MTSDDELTEFEKLIEGMTQLANAMRAYYEALIETGFSETQALILTTHYQHDIVSGIGPQKK